MTAAASVIVRRAKAGDVAVVHGLIRELAAYEDLLDQVEATEADIGRLLFAADASAWCEIAEVDGAAVGFALWFYSVSTFTGQRGIYLEDLFVRPAARRLGVGRALLTALARRCVDEGLTGLEWAVLDWNAPAIAFYDALGAERKSEWLLRRLSGEALRGLASG